MKYGSTCGAMVTSRKLSRLMPITTFLRDFFAAEDGKVEGVLLLVFLQFSEIEIESGGMMCFWLAFERAFEWSGYVEWVCGFSEVQGQEFHTLF
jgi:hypothetical protein